NYWVEVAHFKRMVFRHNNSGPARLLAWKNGESDLLWPVTATDVDQVKDKEGYLYSAYAIAFMCAWFNFHNPNQPVQGLFDDKVRSGRGETVAGAGGLDAEREREAGERPGSGDECGSTGTPGRSGARSSLTPAERGFPHPCPL